jgi:hypothetical protein
MKFAIQLLTSCAFMLPLSATATTISVDITYPTANSSQLYSNPFPMFNPALGTLTSYTLSVSGIVTSPDTYTPDIVFKAPGTFDAILDLSASASGEIAGTRSTSYAGDLAAVTGTGMVSFLEQDFDNVGGITSISYTLDRLTYTYTPAPSVVPEPSSVALISAGFGMLSLVRRKRG